MATLVWFRQDLRVADNPALHAAVEAGEPVVPVFIFAPDEEEAGSAPGGASRWWLHHSLAALDADLRQRGSRLCLYAGGNSLQTLLTLAKGCGATRVFWNRRYEPAAIARDTHIKEALREAGLETASFNGALLHEPWTVTTQSGGPFQVFSPFWRHCKGLQQPAAPLEAASTLRAPSRWPKSDPLVSLSLLAKMDWAAGFREAWQPGSAAAHTRLEKFLTTAFDRYPTQRDRPDDDGTSRMSPHLHFGEISPRQIWHATRRIAGDRGHPMAWRDSTFLAEVGWREFAYHLLYHFPRTPREPLRDKFARMPWKSDPKALRRWQRGATGYPIVDAGLRQLWHTGWMHNRVRMIVGSFLVKDLLLPWTDGAAWFWDTLVDADLASNTLGWQWVAGCGADAAPFFRIFNPTLQGIKFDPQGEYVRRWVPEIAALCDKFIHVPWEASEAMLRDSRIELGHTYPLPIVDHAVARQDALNALKTLKV